MRNLRQLLQILFFSVALVITSPITNASSSSAFAQENNEQVVENQAQDEDDTTIFRVAFFILAGATIVGAVYLAFTFAKRMQRKKQEKEARKKEG